MKPTAGLRLPVRVTPRGGADGVGDWIGSELAIRVASSPVDGKANAAVCALVAAALGVPRSSVRVIRGAASRHKLLSIERVDAQQLFSAFGAPEQD